MHKGFWGFIYPGGLDPFGDSVVAGLMGWGCQLVKCSCVLLNVNNVMCIVAATVTDNDVVCLVRCFPCTMFG